MACFFTQTIFKCKRACGEDAWHMDTLQTFHKGLLNGWNNTPLMFCKQTYSHVVCSLIFPFFSPLAFYFCVKDVTFFFLISLGILIRYFKIYSFELHVSLGITFCCCCCWSWLLSFGLPLFFVYLSASLWLSIYIQ